MHDLATEHQLDTASLRLRMAVMLSCHGIRQTLEGSFSAVSKPNFASKYAFESSRRDLHNALLCTAPKSHFFQKISRICQNLRKFSEILRNSQFFKPIFCENFEIAAVQKDANLVELEKCCQTHIFLQNFVLIQPRTSPPKICKNLLILLICEVRDPPSNFEPIESCFRRLVADHRVRGEVLLEEVLLGPRALRLLRDGGHRGPRCS